MTLPAELTSAGEKRQYFAYIKVGFSPVQASLLASASASWTTTTLIRIGKFTRAQCDALRTSGLTVPELIRQAKFTRAQATLIDSAFNGA